MTRPELDVYDIPDGLNHRRKTFNQQINHINNTKKLNFRREKECPVYEYKGDYSAKRQMEERSRLHAAVNCKMGARVKIRRRLSGS